MTKLAIVSQLTGSSPTGVETHFRAVERQAAAEGIAVARIHPHNLRSPRLIALKLFNRLAGTFGASELCTLIARHTSALALKLRLAAFLKHSDDEPVTLYAQDSLSCWVCAETRRSAAVRLVSVVHFNHSEAEELAVKGRLREGGRLWRSVHAVEQRAMTQADAIVFVSEYMRMTVLARYGPDVAGKSHLIRNFPEDEIDAAGQMPRRDLIAIGTLEPRKNQGFLLRCLHACAALGHRYTLTLVGDGPDRAKLQDEVRELGLSDTVRFAGQIAQAHRLIGDHRALIHTATIENLPLTLIEALAHARPILAVPTGGIPEVFSDQVEGAFLKEGDVDASAATMVQLLSDERRLSAMQAAARQRFEKEFAPHVQWAKLRAILTGESRYRERNRSASSSFAASTAKRGAKTR